MGVSRNSNGFGVMNILISAGIMSTIILGLASFQASQDRSLANTRTILARDELANRLDKYLSNQKILLQSGTYSGDNSAGNLEFQYCYAGIPTGSTPACAPNCCKATAAPGQPFVLVDPADATGNRLLAGTDASSKTSASPVRLSRFGAPCVQAGPECPFEVVASYTADCGGPATCAKAKHVQVSYSIRQAKDVNGNLVSLSGGLSLSTAGKTLRINLGPITGNFTARSIGTGQDHTCALVADTVWCWGDNSYAQLGNSTYVSSKTPVQVLNETGTGPLTGVSFLSVGMRHNCVIASGAAKCWGWNGNGPDGGVGSLISNPCAANAALKCAMIPVQVPGMDHGVQKISAGAVQSCAIKNGALYCWGNNILGALGTGPPNAGFNQVYTNPQPVVGMGSGVTSVSAYGNVTCAIRNGAAKCWGLNSAWGLNAALGNPTAGTPTCYAGNTCSYTAVDVVGLDKGVTAISVGGDYHSCAVQNGAMYCWGYGGGGQMGDGTYTTKTLPTLVPGLGSGVQSISNSYSGVCAVANGAAKCWSDNYYGMAGIGSSGTWIGKPTQVVGLTAGVMQLPDARGAQAHNCALVNGSVYCWGRNTHGQLGDGTSMNSNVPVAVLSF